MGQTPVRVISRPVITDDLDGEQTGEAEYMEVNRMPSCTMLSK